MLLPLLALAPYAPLPAAPLPTAPTAPTATVQAALPSWWNAFLKQPGFRARFVQESGSAVFGTLTRKGTLAAARGGRLRAAYEQGLLLVADGLELVQYDPDTRTAQRWDLREARAEAPLLALLLDPGAAKEMFVLRPLPKDGLRLEPKRKDLPQVELEGKGATPTVLRWTDPSGAKQVLRLDTVVPGAALPPSTFRFDPPKGTRWVGGR